MAYENNDIDQEMARLMMEGGFQGPLEEGKEWDSLNPPPPPNHGYNYDLDPNNRPGVPMPQRFQGYEGPPNPDQGPNFPRYPDQQPQTWWHQPGPQPRPGMEMSPRPDQDYSMGQQLMNWLRTRGPKLTRRSNMYQNGEQMFGPEGEPLTREQIMRFQSPFGPDGLRSPLVGTDQSRFPSGRTHYPKDEPWQNDPESGPGKY